VRPASCDDLLDTLMITQRVPAWAGSRTDRAIRLPKRYVIDPGLITALQRVDQRRILSDGDLLGRTLDAYVAAQLRAECSLSLIGADLFHLRDANGRHEVDLLVETRDGQVITIEVTAIAAPSRADARHPRVVRRTPRAGLRRRPGRPHRPARHPPHRPDRSRPHCSSVVLTPGAAGSRPGLVQGASTPQESRVVALDPTVLGGAGGLPLARSGR
jgi:Domain of unknown function (DUF4143)